MAAAAVKSGPGLRARLGDNPEHLRPVVITGPSGAGKSTVIKKLMAEFPGLFGFSVSHTTRKPRAGEQDGVDYHFTDKETMQAEIDNGDFIEHAVFGGNMYGTSKKAIQDVAGANKICILDIEKNGCESVRKTDLDPLYISLTPPDIKTLEARLRGRGTETDDSLQKRLDEATSAMEYAKTPGKFDLVLVNDNFDATYAAFKTEMMPLIDLAKKLQQKEA